MIPLNGRRKGKTIAVFVEAMVVVSVFVIFIPVAMAEQPFSIMGCSSGTFTALSENDALTIYNISGKGVAWGVTGIKNFNDLTWQFVAVVRIMDGVTTGIGYYKFMDPEGDYFILEGAGDTVLEGGTWKFVSGTGKWKGILGKGRSKLIMRGKPLPIDTEQYWCRIIGSLELPD